MGEIKISGYKCERCTHQWAPRNNKNHEKDSQLPIVCPACKSAYWNIPKKTKRGEK